MAAVVSLRCRCHQKQRERREGVFSVAENKKNPPGEGGLKALYFSAGGGSKPLNTSYSLLRRERGKLELFLNFRTK
jgi:hypothetical protein